MRTALLLALLPLALCAGAHAAAGPWHLANGYFSLSGEASAVSELRLDGLGGGDWGANLVRSLGFDLLRPGPDCAWSRPTPARLEVTGLNLALREELQIKNDGLPEQMPPGHALGQSFRIDRGTFDHLSIPIPTWASTESAATLTLRRGGQVIAQRRLTSIPDNSDQELRFPPQPPGEYVVELSDAVGTPGWWGTRTDTWPGGTAVTDGRAVPERDRALTVYLTRDAGAAEFTAALDDSRLTLTVRLAPGGQAPAMPLIMRMPWDNTGYDVSARAIPFFRFFTDNQRYLPAEQFKRAESPGLGFGPCAWMEAEGTGPSDLRFEAANLSASWSLTDDTNTQTLRTQPVTVSGGATASSVTLVALPRVDSVPAEWPRFETPDPALTRDLNRFWQERAFSYPGPAGPAAWFDWSPTIRFWFDGPLHRGEKANLQGAAMTDEGYVYTWGGSQGWPFPDPTVYDTRHFDTNARYILGCWREVCWSHDMEFLRGQADRLRRAMNYQLTVLQGDQGLIIAASKDVTGRHKGVGDNYWDILPFGYLDAYANAVYYASLGAMADLEAFMAQLPDLQTGAPARTPDQYRHLSDKARAAYNAAFWDDAKGRYIGCIDADGKRHDFGFTFVNVEAMAYGLATPAQARRVYDWMEHGLTASGKADTYSRWVFAPRANTVHNPMWDETGVTDPNASGIEPWWHFGWRGTPFDEQCQDGGAILYTSFFDLMARTRLLGSENAWQRWSEILARYREPDRLCGGPPLFRGEIPQQANPGSVGLDIPFPESGLVPTWFLYGLAGVQPGPEGLWIAPRLPSELPWLVIRNLTFRGLTLDLYVTNDWVEVRSQEPGYEFALHQDLEPGDGFLFRQPPAPVPGFPERRAAAPSAWAAHWVFAPGDPGHTHRLLLRHSFTLDEVPTAARLAATADNGLTLWVNGQQVMDVFDWAQAHRADITSLLRKGANVIAAQVNNVDGPGGMILQGKLTTAAGERVIKSDASWRISTQEAPGWREAGFDDSAWGRATDLGAPPEDPWGNIGEPGL
jgi:hypothetical protein